VIIFVFTFFIYNNNLKLKIKNYEIGIRKQAIKQNNTKTCSCNKKKFTSWSTSSAICTCCYSIEWFKNSNYLIFLSVDNDNELHNLINKLKCVNIPLSIFKEPDLNDQITAISFLSSDKTKKFTSKLSLMLKNNKIS
jgi:hypothetical protein